MEMKVHRAIYYLAAATTSCAGILNIVLSYMIPKGNLQIFLVSIGVLQLFWAFTLIRRWGKSFYSLAIGMTVASIFLWLLTRLPKPILGESSLSISPLSIVIECLQVAFFILTIIVLRSKEEEKERAIPSKTNIINRNAITGATIGMVTWHSRRNILVIGAVILVIGIAGIYYFSSIVVYTFELTKTSVTPYTSSPPVNGGSSLTLEIVFIIIMIVGLTVLSYGAVVTPVKKKSYKSS